eukprot:765951-Hanusia_phi.AAC.5
METATYAPPKLTDTAKNVLIGLTTCERRGGGEEGGEDGGREGKRDGGGDGGSLTTEASRYRCPYHSLCLPCRLRASEASGQEIRSETTEEVRQDAMGRTTCTLACQ